MPTVFDYDLVAALQERGCPMCRVLVLDEARWMDTFWREGKMDAGLRRAFVEAGGFCGRHAWLLHDRVSRAGSGAAIADVYGSLARHDLEWLDRLMARLEQGRRGRRAQLHRRARCAACVAAGEDVERKAAFFVLALHEEAEVRERYSRSDGLCFPHLAEALDAADRAPATALFLLKDWKRRLVDVRDRLAEYDRKRDYRYAHEPKGAEQTSWTDAVRRYAGSRLEPRKGLDGDGFRS